MTNLGTSVSERGQHASAGALSEFAASGVPVASQRAALTALIAAKILPKHADAPEIAAGRAQLLVQALESTSPSDQLLAIAESIRLGQVVKRWAGEIAKQLEPAFVDELPPMQLLTDADDRLNLSRACAQMSAKWLPRYLARSIASEETGEKARGEMIAALLARVGSLADALDDVATAFAELELSTEAPGETVARRLTRTLSALRESLVESDLEAGPDVGKALHRMIAGSLGGSRRPQLDKVQLDLSRESLLTVHDIVRTRISVVSDPDVYRVVEYCRQLCGGASWPPTLRKPLERLITDVTEALLLLGRQGQRDQLLLAQLDVLTNYPERARSLGRDLAARHPELPEDVRDWLENGRVRVARQASASATEAASSNADESIGLALQGTRRARLLHQSLFESLKASLEIYEPALIPTTKELFDLVQVLAVQMENAASLRGLDLYGTPGESVEMSAKFFNVVGDAPRQQMIVRQPAVVRRRADGAIGDVVTKGLVE